MRVATCPLGRSFAVFVAVSASACAPGGGGDGDGGPGELQDWPTELLSEFPAFPELNGYVAEVKDLTGTQDYWDLYAVVQYERPPDTQALMQTYRQRLVGAGFFYGAGSNPDDGSSPVGLVFCGTRGQFDMCELNHGSVEIGRFDQDEGRSALTFYWSYDP